MKTIIKEYILFLCCILLTATYGNAQGIKQQQKQQQQRQQQEQQQQEQKKRQEQQRQQQYEREQREKKHAEETRIEKAQLNLNDLLQLLQSKDADYVDAYLTDRGWKLHSTSVKETNDYDREILSDYKMVTWSFDKNPNDDLARSWFYFYLYPNYDNAIAYTIADEAQLDKLKSVLVPNGYERIYPTDIIERGLESVYRNDFYEVNFKKQLKKQSDEGADINYSFFIYNYKQIEERKAEAERLAREATEKERKYRNAVQRAEDAHSQKQYATARQAYTEAATVKPENAEISDKIAAVDIDAYCQDAENYFRNKQYGKAREEYGKALSIRPNLRTDYINGKIAEIDALTLFLKERTYRQYDYKKIEPVDYNAKNRYIENELQRNLLAGGETLPKTIVNFECATDTFGITASDFSASIRNKNLNTILERLNRDINLKPCFVNAYPVNAKAEFNYTIEYNHSLVTLKKGINDIVPNSRDFYPKSIDNDLVSAPYGKYTFDVNRIIINGQEYNNNKLIKMRGTSGPSNALLSLLVPGLGDSRVVYGGKKRGITVALATYGLIGAGIGCKIYSDSEYKKYHEASIYDDIDTYYRNANDFNKMFYTCVGTGAILWLYDIVWVCVKGAKNKKEFNAWKRSYLSVYSEPNLRANGLSYTINF
ncbi:MAG: hypothetical protein LBK97_07295 [Prevotellaceae bacterium]|jgi:hypothetical protein|nr:hypothetical protein [Prevotellaceae bacterium]